MTQRKQYGHWKIFENVRRVLIKLERKLGHFPTQKEIRDEGYSGLVSATYSYHGGISNVAESMGRTPTKRSNGYWTLDNTLKECRKLVRKERDLPNQDRMRKAGLGSLEFAIAQHGGRYRIRELLGIEDKAPERPKGYWTLDRVLETYKDLTKQLGHPPTNSDLDRLDYNGMAWTISNKYGGYNTIRKKLDIEGYRRDGYWTREQVLKTCRKLVKEEGDLPTNTELIRRAKKEKELRGLTSGISKIGGLRKVRDLLKLEQKTVEDGHWTRRNIREEAKRIVEEIGYLPVQRELSQRGMNAFVGAVAKNYGMVKLRRDLCLKVGKVENGYWTQEKILRECRKIVRKEGDLPSNKKLNKMGYGALSAQICRTGFRNIREKLGINQNLKEKNYWQDEKNALKEARKIIKEKDLETLPSGKQLCAMGYSSLGAVINLYHGGFTEFRKKLGEEPGKLPNNALKNWSSFKGILQEIIDEIGHFPSHSDLEKLGKKSVSVAIYGYHGGTQKVRQKMGYEIIETGTQLRTFLSRNKQALAISSLASVYDNPQEIADTLVKLWPSRFPSAADLAKSLPSAVRHIGHSLHPFSLEKARGIYEKIKTVPSVVKYALDDLLYTIAIEQYQTAFNDNPRKTVAELENFASEGNGISKLASRVLKYYQEVSSFSIPGYGTLERAA